MTQPGKDDGSSKGREGKVWINKGAEAILGTKQVLTCDPKTKHT